MFDDEMKKLIILALVRHNCSAKRTLKEDDFFNQELNRIDDEIKRYVFQMSKEDCQKAKAMLDDKQFYSSIKKLPVETIKDICNNDEVLKVWANHIVRLMSDDQLELAGNFIRSFIHYQDMMTSNKEE